MATILSCILTDCCVVTPNLTKERKGTDIVYSFVHPSHPIPFLIPRAKSQHYRKHLTNKKRETICCSVWCPSKFAASPVCSPDTQLLLSPVSPATPPERNLMCGSTNTPKFSSKASPASRYVVVKLWLSTRKVFCLPCHSPGKPPLTLFVVVFSPSFLLVGDP